MSHGSGETTYNPGRRRPGKSASLESGEVYHGDRVNIRVSSPLLSVFQGIFKLKVSDLRTELDFYVMKVCGRGEAIDLLGIVQEVFQEAGLK